MGKEDKILAKMLRNPSSIRFEELKFICDLYFGEPRNTSTSHHIYKTPWQGDPRSNIQNSKGKAKPYQVRQVLSALEKLKEQR